MERGERGNGERKRRGLWLSVANGNGGDGHWGDWLVILIDLNTTNSGKNIKATNDLA